MKITVSVTAMVEQDIQIDLPDEMVDTIRRGKATGIKNYDYYKAYAEVGRAVKGQLALHGRTLHKIHSIE